VPLAGFSGASWAQPLCADRDGGSCRGSSRARRNRGYFLTEAPRPVRVELLGDTVESVREFDPRTQRSIAPVNWTTVLPLTEWAVMRGDGAEAWALPTYWGRQAMRAQDNYLKLSPSFARARDFSGGTCSAASWRRMHCCEKQSRLTKNWEWQTRQRRRIFLWQVDEFELALQIGHTEWSWNNSG